MKTAKLFVTISLVGLLVACSTHPQPIIDDEPVWAEYALIKLNNEQLEKIMVMPIVQLIVNNDQTFTLTYNYDTLALPNTPMVTNLTDSNYIKFCQNQLVNSLHSPYIVLDNGYAIVNWRWRPFHPLAATEIFEESIDEYKSTIISYSPYPNYNNGNIINEELYLINEKWTDKALSQVWKLSDAEKTDKPEVRYIKLKKIDEYRKDIVDKNTLVGNTQNDPDFLSAFKSYQYFLKNKELYTNYVTQCDSIEEVYIETLNDIIKNGLFDSLTSKF